MLRSLCVVVVLAAGLAHARPPKADRDGDGIDDAHDRCPDAPEDFDSFEDADGCPDPDNDRDRILDQDDMCPNAPESYNGYQDSDGCPDKAVTHIVNGPDLIVERIYFGRGSAAITALSRPILDAIAGTLNGNPALTSTKVIGHAGADERRATALSAARARAVSAYLVAHGVATGRLHAIGKGVERPGAKQDPKAHRAVEFDTRQDDAP